VRSYRNWSPAGAERARHRVLAGSEWYGEGP